MLLGRNLLQIPFLACRSREPPCQRLENVHAVSGCLGGSPGAQAARPGSGSGSPRLGAGCFPAPGPARPGLSAPGVPRGAAPRPAGRRSWQGLSKLRRPVASASGHLAPSQERGGDRQTRLP